MSGWTGLDSFVVKLENLGEGLLPADWGGSISEDGATFGEPRSP